MDIMGRSYLSITSGRVKRCKLKLSTKVTRILYDGEELARVILSILKPLFPDYHDPKIAI